MCMLAVYPYLHSEGSDSDSGPIGSVPNHDHVELSGRLGEPGIIIRTVTITISSCRVSGRAGSEE